MAGSRATPPSRSSCRASRPRPRPRRRRPPRRRSRPAAARSGARTLTSSVDAGYHAPVDAGTASPPDDSPRVLVVDDEKVIREILSDFLTMEGYVVRAVEDGSAAMKELRLRPYD